MRVVNVYEDLVNITGDFTKAVLLRYLIDATAALTGMELGRFLYEEMLRAGRRDIFGEPRQHGWLRLPLEVINYETLLRFRNPSSIVKHMKRLADNGLIWMLQLPEKGRPWVYRVNLPCIASRLYRMGSNLRVHWDTEMPFCFDDLEETAYSGTNSDMTSKTSVSTKSNSTTDLSGMITAISDKSAGRTSIIEDTRSITSKNEGTVSGGKKDEAYIAYSYNDPSSSVDNGSNHIRTSAARSGEMDSRMQQALEVLDRLGSVGPPDADENPHIAEFRSNEISDVGFNGSLSPDEKAERASLLRTYGYQAVKRAVIYCLHAQQQDLGIIHPIRYIRLLVDSGNTPAAGR